MSDGRRSQIARVSTGFLNTVNDPVPGNSIASPTGALDYSGLVGQEFELTAEQAAALSKTTIGTLYAGRYKYVKCAAGSTAANARGQVVVWSDVNNYVVTPDVAATTAGLPAGVTLNVVTKGNYGFIQVQGKATVLYRASVTDKTLGNLIVQLTTTNTFDAIADATGTYISGGVKGLKNIRGVAIELPTDGGLKLASIWPANLNIK